MRIKRIYHPYTDWEDFQNGMWEIVSKHEEAKHLKAAIEFTGNAELYGSWMLKVINAWPRGCEHNLTNDSMNRLAWIGHAATCMAIGCPEYITRQAWAHLTQQQRDEANAKAEYALQTWLHNHRMNGAQYVFEY